MKAFIVLTVILVLSCHPKHIQYEPVTMPGYVYVQVSSEVFHVVTPSQEFLKIACAKHFGGICTFEPAGTYWIVNVPAGRF